ncbi:MAG: polysaccharide biosynthesis/export family protein [Pseudomonadota bacterium]
MPKGFSNCAVVLALFILAACATDRSFGSAPSITATDLDALPVPSGGVRYRIGPQESLEIQVVGAELLSGTFLTDAEGNLSYPLIGSVPLAGKSPSEASAMIANNLRGDYMIDPQVRVIPEEFPPPSISVGGEVRTPGNYPAVGGQTLLRAVNQAGGLGEYAERTDVLVLREVSGAKYIGAYNLEAIARGNYEDPRLYPNDIVLVGDSPMRKRVDQLLQVLPALLTTTAILIQRN